MWLYTYNLQNEYIGHDINTNFVQGFMLGSPVLTLLCTCVPSSATLFLVGAR